MSDRQLTALIAGILHCGGESIAESVSAAQMIMSTVGSTEFVDEGDVREKSCLDMNTGANVDLVQAYQQLFYLWNSTGSCPCGARRESPRTHPHVGGCPTAKAIEVLEE